MFHIVVYVLLRTESGDVHAENIVVPLKECVVIR